jgi:acyl carrier protein
MRNTVAMEWTREALTERVYEILRDELLTVGADFTPKSNLIDAGLDSLAVTQLLLAIEESTGVWVDESLLTEETLASAESFAACVHAHIAHA